MTYFRLHSGEIILPLDVTFLGEAFGAAVYQLFATTVCPARSVPILCPLFEYDPCWYTAAGVTFNRWRQGRDR